MPSKGLGAVSDIKIKIIFFGGFRKLGKNIDIIVPKGSSVNTVKEALVLALNGKEEHLIGASVLANDNAILQDDTVFNEDVQLSILPPVCGG